MFRNIRLSRPRRGGRKLNELWTHLALNAARKYFSACPAYHVPRREIWKTIKIFIFILLIWNKARSEKLIFGAASNLIKWYFTPSSTALIMLLQREFPYIRLRAYGSQRVPSTSTRRCRFEISRFYRVKVVSLWLRCVGESFSAMLWSLKLSLSMTIRQKRDTCLDSFESSFSREKHAKMWKQTCRTEIKKIFNIYFDMWNTN